MIVQKANTHGFRTWARDERGVLKVGDTPIVDLLEPYGTPAYVYDETILRRQLSLLEVTFPDFEIYYSVKANPDPRVISYFARQAGGLEIASVGELELALDAGCDPNRILFAGPGKTSEAMCAALSVGIEEFHLESFGEIQRLQNIAAQMDLTARVSLRVNPPSQAQAGAMRMGGRATQFGIDADQLPAAVDQIEECGNLCLDGLHFFVGTQILDADHLLQAYDQCVSISRQVGTQIRRPLRSIDFGGGLGIPYFAHESELDLTAVQRGIQRIVQLCRSHKSTAEAKLMIEPGRFLVAPAGIYVASVVDTKRSYGSKFVVLDGGMNHHLAASGNLGQTIKRNFPIAILNRCNDDGKREKVNLAGPLCTPLDTLGRNVELPALRMGDLIGVFVSGAYGRSASPLGFLSHRPPVEIFVSANGETSALRHVVISEASQAHVSPQSS